jgi:hypothetical protein
VKRKSLWAEGPQELRWIVEELFAAGYLVRQRSDKPKRKADPSSKNRSRDDNVEFLGELEDLSEGVVGCSDLDRAQRQVRDA